MQGKMQGKVSAAPVAAKAASVVGVTTKKIAPQMVVRAEGTTPPLRRYKKKQPASEVPRPH
jgi:hypothetical protein